MTTQEKDTPSEGRQLPAAKQTSLGLYVTAAEAYEMWKADPEQVKVLDVRMVEEYVFLGHAEGAVNIPVAFPKYEWHADKRKYGFEINPDFIDHVKAVFRPDDTIVAMCRSGGRSAFAINMLAKAGFTNLYNIIDGFEGDTVERSRKRLPRQADEERLEELRALDLRSRPGDGMDSDG